jgi:uncharacterized protein YdaT
MSNEKNHIYVEKHPDGYQVRRSGAERPSAVKDTQKEAIERAREIAPGIRPDVERVKHIPGKPSPGKWRKA